MKISLKIFLGYFALVGLAAWFVLTIFVDEVKPGVRQAMESSAGDTGNAQGKPPHLHYTVCSLVPYPWLASSQTQGYKKMFFINPVDTFK